MKHGRNKTLIPHVMSQWGATMVRNSASLLGYIYIQSLLTNIISKDNMGLYRDDGYLSFVK